MFVFIFILSPSNNMPRGKERPKNFPSKSRRKIVRNPNPAQEIIPAASLLNNTVYRFVQTSSNSILQQTATAPFLFAFNFQLAFIDQSSTYTALFDQYKIEHVELTFSPMFRANSLSNVTTAAIVPLIYVALDYDDGSTPSSLTTLREYQNLVVRSDEKSFSVTLNPHIAMSAYNGAFAGYANVVAPWLDCSTTNIQHYGVKVGIDAALTGQTVFQAWNVTTRYHLAFRNVR